MNADQDPQSIDQDRLPLLGMVVRGFGPNRADAANIASSGRPQPIHAESHAKQGHRQAVRSLLDSGAKVDVAGADGMTALMWAAQRNDIEMADRLLRAGADVKAANDYGATALYAAAANADPEMAAMLLAAGGRRRCQCAPVVWRDAAHGGGRAWQPRNAARIAVARSESERTGSKWRANRVDVGDIGAPVHGHGGVGATWRRCSRPLEQRIHRVDVRCPAWRCRFGRVLLSAGANPNDIMSKTGLTPLIIAAAMGRTKVATLLLDKGANPEAVDTDGFTPLHHAARTKDASETVRSLLHHRAKPNVRLSQKKPTVAASGIVLQGATPLALAAEINNLDTVERRPSLPFAPAPKQPAPGHEHGRQGRCGLPITGGRLGRHDNATRAIDGDGASGPCGIRARVDPGANRRGANEGDGKGRAVRAQAQADGASNGRSDGSQSRGRKPDGHRAELQREPFDDQPARSRRVRRGRTCQSQSSTCSMREHQSSAGKKASQRRSLTNTNSQSLQTVKAATQLSVRTMPTRQRREISGATIASVT
jgi:ankyrin repeat protein